MCKKQIKVDTCLYMQLNAICYTVHMRMLSPWVQLQEENPN